MGDEGSLGQLVKQYQEEFQEGVEFVRTQLGADINAKIREYMGKLEELHPKIMQQRKELVQAVQDQSPVEGLDMGRLMKTFAWAAVMLMGMSVSYFLSRFFLAPFIGLFLSCFAAFVVSQLVVPYLAWYYLSRPADENDENDRNRRHLLLLVAIAEGLLTGSMYSHRSLSGFGPLPAVTAIAIAAVAGHGAAFIGTDRVKLLGASLGGGLVAHLVWGLFVGYSMPFLMLAILYTASAFVILQMYIKNVSADKVFTHVYQLALVCAVVTCDALVMLLMSGDSEEMAEQARADADAAAASE